MADVSWRIVLRDLVRVAFMEGLDVGTPDVDVPPDMREGLWRESESRRLLEELMAKLPVMGTTNRENKG